MAAGSEPRTESAIIAFGYHNDGNRPAGAAMKLQKSTLFALYAVLELARDPARQLSTADIAEQYGISGHHLAKVMRTLVRAGLAQSVRGAGGGYRFAGNPSRTTLLDVIELFEPLASELAPPDTDSNRDPDAGRATPVAAALGTVGEEIDEMTRATLASITLKSLLKHVEKAAPDTVRILAAE